MNRYTSGDDGGDPERSAPAHAFLQDQPQNVGMSGGAPEQIAGCTALQHTCMTGPGALGRLGGRIFRDQGRRAFPVRPQATNPTWWNEWTAQRFEDEAGDTRFADNHNEPLSRDIEPQDPAQVDSHGDLSYQWTKRYVAAYRDHAALPEDLVQ